MQRAAFPFTNSFKYLLSIVACRQGHFEQGTFLVSEFSEKLSKRIFIICAVIVVLGAAFLYGVIAQALNFFPVPQLRAVYGTVSTISESGLSDNPVGEHLQPTRGQGEGVTVNTLPEDGALVFMAGFFDEENQIRLIRRDGTLVRKWSLDYTEHFPDAETRPCRRATPLRVDVHGALATPAGEVIFNYEYCGTVKLDACGGLIWRIAKPTHHSLVPARGGGYWLLGRYFWGTDRNPDRFPPFSVSRHNRIMLDDTLLRIGEDGSVIEESSIPVMMRDSGLEAVLTATGERFEPVSPGRNELVHANKVAELSPEIADAYPLFEAGDLAISMRKLNLVMVVDPKTKRVKWHQTGPWLRPHDPEFRPDGRISVFNNNAYRTAYPDAKVDLNSPFSTNIMVVDPVSRETEVIFGERPGQEMLSVIRGQHELLDEDGMLITEFDGGRVLQVTAEGEIVWEYINRYDDEFVGEITNAMIYSEDYFEGGLPACSP